MRRTESRGTLFLAQADFEVGTDSLVLVFGLTAPMLTVHAFESDARPAGCPIHQLPDPIRNLRGTPFGTEDRPVRIFLFELSPAVQCFGWNRFANCHLVSQMEPLPHLPNALDAPPPTGFVAPDAGPRHQLDVGLGGRVEPEALGQWRTIFAEHGRPRIPPKPRGRNWDGNSGNSGKGRQPRATAPQKTPVKQGIFQTNPVGSM